jgi:hypothetical protein
MKKYAKDNNSEPYVMLENSMTNSAAWTALSFTAVWVYIELKKRFSFEHKFSRLIMPYSEVSWKMASYTYSKAIKELVKYGFIKYVEHGGFPNRPNVFALSEGWEAKSIEIVHTEGREATRLKHKDQERLKEPMKQSLNQTLETSK